MARYPDAMHRWPHPPREVAAADLVTQEEAARVLGCRMLTVGSLVAQGRLLPVTAGGAAGVERASLERELHWRRTTRLWRVRSLLRGVWHSL
jgi:hypothetical protein